MSFLLVIFIYDKYLDPLNFLAPFIEVMVTNQVNSVYTSLTYCGRKLERT